MKYDVVLRYILSVIPPTVAWGDENVPVYHGDILLYKPHEPGAVRAAAKRI